MKCFLFIFLFSASNAFALTCPKIKRDAFDKLLEKSGETKVYFFASWCGECKASLKALGPKDIAMASFDEQSAAESVMTKLAVTTRCFTSDGVAESFGVKGVPDVRVIINPVP